MRLVVLAEQHLRLETEGPGLDISGEFGPIEMLATSLLLCTAAVITTYGETARLDLAPGRFALEVRWEYAEHPYRVVSYALTIFLPATISPERQRAVLRAAETCTVHATLSHPPQISSRTAPLDGTLPT